MINELITEPDAKHEYVLRLVIEDITYIPTKMVIQRIDHPGEDFQRTWEVENTLESEEYNREVIKGIEILNSDLTSVEDAFKIAAERATSPRLTTKQVEGIKEAIRYGLEQPEAAELKEMIKQLKPLTKSLIVSEIVHSLNRKGMVPNDSVEKLIHYILDKEET